MVSLGIFSVVPPTEPCALRSIQPLKVNTRDLFWGKGGRCVWLTTYHPCSAETLRKSGALIYPEPLGPPRPFAGHLYFTLLKRKVQDIERLKFRRADRTVKLSALCEVEVKWIGLLGFQIETFFLKRHRIVHYVPRELLNLKI